MSAPFRWDLSKREQLGGRIADRPMPPAPYAGFFQDLRTVSAKVLATADTADLAFVGRTPENLFDYLSGVFLGVEGAPRLNLLPFSLRWIGPPNGPAGISEAKLRGLFAAFTACGVSCVDIAAADRPLALVDFVASGGTMESLITLWRLEAQRTHTDWAAVQRRLRVIGLRARTKNSPNTWRWQQNQDWLHLVPDMTIKNVSAPPRLVYFLANDQTKVTHAFHPGRWDAEQHGAEPPTSAQLDALAFAAGLFDRGRTRRERQALAGAIARDARMHQAATRALVLALKRAGSDI